MSQHLFLLCGLPFSGKSTMGRALAEELGLIHVEVDRHRSDRAGRFGERRVERAEWITAYRADGGAMKVEAVVFDVGATLTDETRVWSAWNAT